MRVPLTSGAYAAKSVAASAQRCVNLYPESNPAEVQPAAPVTHYPTPGLIVKGVVPETSGFRALYAASTDDLYAVVGSTLYYVDPQFRFQALGQVAQGASPVSVADNGTDAIVVDGSEVGYQLGLASRQLQPISAAGFYGGDTVGYADTYFVTNRPGTSQFVVSDSNSTAFDALYVATKSGASDPLVALHMVHKEVWLLGSRTTEVWYVSGEADFPFSRLPGVFLEQGCAARYSVASHGASLFWLARDKDGGAQVVAGVNYQPSRASTYALEAEIQTYPRIDDAVGYCYQQEGHAFYVLNFPSADKTWVLDIGNGQWHERSWTDGSGRMHRHRGACHAYAYGLNLVGDRESGKLYALDPRALDDAGAPIVRLRSFPTIAGDQKRHTYWSLIADMEVGTTPGVPLDAPPMLGLRYSDSRGASWGERIEMPMGASGQHETSIKFNRLGQGRNRVFELSWSASVRTALNGVYLDTAPQAS